MRCVYCGDRAGLLRRICHECQRLAQVFRSLPSSYGFRELLDRFFETGVSNEKIDRFLHADVDGSGSIQDHLTARMTNEVMGALGQPSPMTGPGVKKVREMVAEGKAPSKTDVEVVDYSQLQRKG